jgi:putative transposase
LNYCGGVIYGKRRPFRGSPVQLETVKEEKDWFVIITCKVKDPPELTVDPEKVVGLDLGVKRLGTTSDGKYKKTLDLTKADVNKVRLQQELERRSVRAKDGKLKPVQSKQRRKTLKMLGKACRHGRNKRKDFLHKYSHKYSHKFSHKLVKRIDHLGIEDLKVKRMTESAKGTVENPGKNVAQKKGLNRAILAMGWTMFVAMLRYKLEMKGGQLILVNPRFTSQICSKCKTKDRKSRRSQSVFVCTSCGFEINADQNASRNIRDRALTALGF